MQKKIRFLLRDEGREGLLEPMIDYAESKSCRRRILLDYFGSRGSDSDPAACCDICRDGPASPRPVDDDRLVLCCVQLTGERYGARYIADVLCGSLCRRVRENRHDALSLWGKGRTRPRAYWQELCRSLTARGLLVCSPEYSLLSLSMRGRAELKSLETNTQARAAPVQEPLPQTQNRTRDRAPADKERKSSGGVGQEGSSRRQKPCMGQGAGEALPPRQEAPATESDPAVPIPTAEYERIKKALREYRSAQAARRGIPAYCLFSNKTLEALAELRPQNNRELLKVPGIGSARSEALGRDLLRIIADPD